MNINNNSNSLIWTAVYKPSGEFVCSKRITVKCRILARKFSSRAQAKEFLSTSEFDLKDCSFVAYQDPASTGEEKLFQSLTENNSQLGADGRRII